MKESISSRTYSVLFFVAAVAAIGLLGYKVLKPFFAGIAWAIVFAVVFQSVWRPLARRFPKRRGLVAGGVTAGIALLVLLPASLFVVALAQQAADVSRLIADQLSQANVRSYSDFVALPAVSEFLEDLSSRVGMTQEEFQRAATGFVGRASKVAAALSGKLVLSVFDGFLTASIALFVLFFLLRDGEPMARAALSLVPVSPEGRAELGRSLEGMVRSAFRGSLLCSLVQGLTGGIGWWIAGLPSPALAGTAMGILALLPIGGAALVWFPGSVWLWLDGQHGWAVFLFVWGAVITSFLADNVLRPILIGSGARLSTMVVFLGVFGGLSAFGLLGMFIGPIVLGVAGSLFDVLSRQAEWNQQPAAPEPPAELAASEASP